MISGRFSVWQHFSACEQHDPKLSEKLSEENLYWRINT
jgi:hypothetical protein